tara:strand:+ start:270 stop:1028 length:759 start_codon:yes stop_codon:yes gene_type:complete
MSLLNNAKIIIQDLKNIYNNNYKVLITIISGFILVFFIRTLLAILDTMFTVDEYPIQRILFMLSSTLLIIGLEIGFTRLILNALNNQKIALNHIFNYFDLLWKYIQGLFCFYFMILIATTPLIAYLYFQYSSEIFSILYNSINDPYFEELISSYVDFQNLLVSVLLFIVPVLYLSLRSFLWTYLVIDKEIGGYLALKKSFQLTQNKSSEIICYLFLIALFNLVGLLSIIGICFTIPITYIFLCKYYKLFLKN